MEEELKLQKFDMNMIDYDKVVVLIGKRETGKSYLVKDLLYHHQDIPIGTVISGTEASNQFYGKIFPKLFIHEEYNDHLVENYLKRQKLVIKELNKEKQHGGSSNIDPRGVLILDDCLFDKTWIHSKNIRSLFMNGRHYKTLFIVTMQYSLGIPPVLRTNCDFVFILRENYKSNRKRLFEQFAGMFDSFEYFCQVMDQCTENYECLVINNNAKSNKLQDQVFWYKAEPHEDFVIGAPEFWQHHSQHYNYDSNEEDDYNVVNIKSKKIKVNVKKTF